MKIRPIRDLVLCEVLPKPDMTASGLHIPDSVRGREERAVVVSVGGGGFSKKGHVVKPAVGVGDVIFFDPYQIEWSETSGTTNSAHARAGDHMLVREQHIRGVEE